MHEPSAVENGRIRLDAFVAKRATRADVEARQRRRLKTLLEFVLRQSRFYSRHYRDVDRPITDLGALPPVTKSTLMEHFDDVVTDTAVTRPRVDAFVADASNVGRRFLGRYPVWLTSGTTGEPGTFLQDERTLTVADAVSDRWSVPALFASGTVGSLFRNDVRTAELAVSGGHYAAASGVAMYRREHRFLRDRLRLFSPKRPLPELVESLDEFQPAILVGYASVLVELAREQRAGRLNLDPAFVAPSGEPISDAEKQELRSAFDCTVREIYGATEFYAIAVECAHGNLHANTDWVVLEPVDEEYRPVDPGEPSDTVLVTNLANRIQPVVRYDLGDSVTMYEDRCPCGSAFPVVEVAGRQGDVLHFAAEDGTTVPVFPLAISSVVEEVPDVRRTQILQTAPRSLSVRLEVADDAAERRVWDRVERDLRDFLERHGVTGVSIESASEPPNRDADSGKFRHVWSAVE
ncbi:phenylacetate--CoA ligase family protein [Haloarchaeobius sp. HRN-SO-5]|uniref:phenylacetate--CoA ligase family protein n=1 Tax=Haloarchaeobius sp. HRN-SO-5 TaxID=3446118 RepID=UPI003EBC07D4